MENKGNAPMFENHWCLGHFILRAVALEWEHHDYILSDSSKIFSKFGQIKKGRFLKYSTKKVKNWGYSALYGSSSP